MRRTTCVRRSFSLLLGLFLSFSLAPSRAFAVEPDEELTSPSKRPQRDLAPLTAKSGGNPSERIQATDLLVLLCEGNLTGQDGETPTTQSGVSFETGISGSGAYFAPGNQVNYTDTGNIDATNGSMSFWIKPRWNGNDGASHAMLSY